MGVPSDDTVLIEKGKQPGDPHIVTVNCPDKTALACDICRTILDFGLYITKGGESCISCEPQLTGPEYECYQGMSSLSPVIAEEIFHCEMSDKEIHSQALSPDISKLKKANVSIDNSLSPSHTLLQVHCLDHKGLLYDIMRTLKDCKIQISYGRFLSENNVYRDLDLFIQQKDGKKIVDAEKKSRLCSRLKVEMLHPLGVIIADRGPDTELLVANPVELSRKGRPRVFYDVTLALKSHRVCIFSAEIGRYSTSDREYCS